VILAVAWFVATFVGSLVSELLAGIGLNEFPTKLGFRAALPEQASPSNIAGKLIVFFAMVFAIVEAANRLGFTQVAELVATFIQFGASVLLGAVIILIGLWLSNLAADAITGIGVQNAS
jgi:hypothetical protein